MARKDLVINGENENYNEVHNVPKVIKVYNKLMFWNCQGLQSKLCNDDFKEYCKRFDIFSLSEIWKVKREDLDNYFSEYKIVFAPRTKALKGGVAVFIKHSIIDLCNVLMQIPDAVFIKIDKSITGTPSDILAGFIYMAPENSSIYDEDSLEGFDVLENNMFELSAKFPDLPWSLFGDFNSRTFGLVDNFTESNPHAQPLIDLEELFDDTPVINRNSKDKSVNNFGKKLVTLCNEWNLCIMNGRTPGDEHGEITCIANGGRSIVDYAICAPQLFNFVQELYVDDRCESDHFPLVLSFKNDVINCMDEEIDIALNDIESYEWNEDYASDFRLSLTNQVNNHLNLLKETLNESIEEGSNLFISFMHEAAAKMKKQKRSQLSKDKKIQPPWWDIECNTKKLEKYRALKKFRRSNDVKDLDNFIACKKAFKVLCNLKKVEHRENVLTDLNAACNEHNSKIFWRKVKNLTRNTYNTSKNSISAHAWFNYFKTLLNIEEVNEENAITYADFEFETEFSVRTHNEDNGCYDCQEGILDDIITEEEILEALNNLKRGKAAGPDGICSDFFIESKNIVVKLLHPLFNKVFESGIYPESWAKAIIFPLHKKGNPRCVDNYRGISLINITSKLYSSVINKRLYVFSERNECIPEAQAGFRKGYSTVDNIFTLQSLVEKYLTRKGGRFFTLFVDFSKAYDCVNRRKLLYLLLKKTGIHGKMFSTLRSMYSNVKSSVRIDSKITEYFDCFSGVKQGCVLSPLLFSLFLSELQSELINSTTKGIDIFSDPIGVLLLMYADDLALVSDNVIDLQRKIDCLEKYCNKWGLTVNMSKTKVVVFKNGGFVKESEKWYFGGEKVQVVADYNYLGVIFGSSLNWSKCVKNLSAKARKAVAGIKRLQFTLVSIPVNTLFKIFDTKVKPILLYGSEVWGFQKYDEIEQVQIKFCKSILGVGRDVKNIVAMGECGRFPIFIDSYCRVIKFWCKIMEMNDKRYPKQCYNMLVAHDKSGRINWVTKIRNILYKYGYGFVWEAQGVGDSNTFFKIFKQRLIDNYKQDWDSMLDNPLDVEYRNYHITLERPKYVDDLISRCHRRSICLLRCNRLELNALVRFGEQLGNPICNICNMNAIEDYCHFFFVCPAYLKIRRQYVPIYYHRFPSTFKYTLLLRNMNESTALCFKIANYVNAAMSIRRSRLSM